MASLGAPGGGGALNPGLEKTPSFMHLHLGFRGGEGLPAGLGIHYSVVLDDFGDISDPAFRWLPLEQDHCVVVAGSLQAMSTWRAPRRLQSTCHAGRSPPPSAPPWTLGLHHGR